VVGDEIPRPDVRGAIALHKGDFFSETCFEVFAHLIPALFQK
jgi:hypothetical protein